MAWRTVIIENSASLSFKDNKLVITNDDEIHVPLEDIDSLILEAPAMRITKNILLALTDNKINVLRYVATITENKKGSNNVATVEVIDRTIYDEYEIFNIKVTNNSSNTIMINRKEDNDGIYAKYSGSNLNYTAFTSEIYENSLTIEPNQTKYLSVRIDKLYNE